MSVLANEAAELAVAPTLVVNHYAAQPAFMGDALWQRVWSPNAKATIWPETGAYNTVLLPLPQGKDSLRLCLNAATGVLKDDGQILLYGENDLGIKSADSVARDYFGSVETVFTGGHGRIWRLQNPIRHAIKTRIEDFKTGTPPWVTYPGLFAGGKLDEATALLLEHLPAIPPGAEVMDFACGIGVIAHTIKGAAITVVDNNPLALCAATANVPHASTVLCGEPKRLQGQYDFILSNPPIHEGKELSYSIVHDLIAALPKLLKETGAAYIVAQVTVPVQRMAAAAGLACGETAKSRSFRVSRISR